MILFFKTVSSLEMFVAPLAPDSETTRSSVSQGGGHSLGAIRALCGQSVAHAKSPADATAVLTGLFRCARSDEWIASAFGLAMTGEASQ